MNKKSLLQFAQPLRINLFRYFWLSTLITHITGRMYLVAISWEIMELSGMPLFVAAVFGAGAIASFIFTLPAAALTTKFSKIKIICYAVTWIILVIISLIILFLSNHINPLLIVIITFLLAMGQAILMPSWQATIADLVQPELLKCAVTLNSMSFNVARIVGPAIAILLTIKDFILFIFILNLLGYIFMLCVFIYLYRNLEQKRNIEEGKMKKQIAFSSLIKKASFISLLKDTFIFFFITSLFWSLLPVITEKILLGGIYTYGYIIICLGVGSIIGGISLPFIRTHLSDQHILALGVVLFALSCITMLFNPNEYLLFLILLCGGTGWISVTSTLNYAAINLFPENYRAKAIATYLVVFHLSIGLGSIFWGFITTNNNIYTIIMCAMIFLLLVEMISIYKLFKNIILK